MGIHNSSQQVPPPPHRWDAGEAFLFSHFLPVGTMLDGRYRIERYLASGGFGNTYVAFDTRFNSRVAIKEFFMHGTNHRDGNSSAVVVSNVANVDGFNQQLDKFRREAKRIFDMRNDHIVHVIDLFDANGTSYYVMDFIEGESLSARVKRGPLTEAEVRDVAAQLASCYGMEFDDLEKWYDGYQIGSLSSMFTPNSVI